jgi:ribosome-associated protein
MSPPPQGSEPQETAGSNHGSRTVEGSAVRVNSSLRIPLAELQFRFAPSGGPGGQRANKVSTRVELRFDVAGSPTLGPRQRARLVERIGPELRIVADDERSQSRNRALAVERFRQRVAEALHVDPPRRPTRPTRAAKERRLADKRRNAERKKNRRVSPDE